MTHSAKPQPHHFFNDRHHFDHLRHRLLPQLMEYAKSGHRVRLWSADCGTGEEPYSMAMTILDLAPDAYCFDIRILATESQPLALEMAEAGSYDSKAVAAVPELYKARWLEPQKGALGTTYKVDDAVRRLIRFEQLDLEKPFHMRNYFNAIFCRHGFEQLSEAERARVWARLMPHLAPGGTLYTGLNDRITGPALRQLRMAGNATYLRSAA